MTTMIVGNELMRDSALKPCHLFYYRCRSCVGNELMRDSALKRFLVAAAARSYLVGNELMRDSALKQRTLSEWLFCSFRWK